MLVLHPARGLAVLDSRKRLLGGAVITVVGLGTALLFRKPPEEPRNLQWPSGFTEVQPSAPLVNPAPPEPVQPQLAGRIESLAESPTTSTPATGSMYQLPGSEKSLNSTEKMLPSAAPVDPFLRAGSSYSLPPANESTTNDKPDSESKVYSLSELKPLKPLEESSIATSDLAEPAKLNPAQQAAATSLPMANTASLEHSAGYRWSPNRSNPVEPLAQSNTSSLNDRPSLLPPPPVTGMPNLATPLASTPATGYQLPSNDSMPSLALQNTPTSTNNYAPAPPLMAANPLQPPMAVGGSMVHRIVDGDSLATLARRYYGDEQRARDIFESNRAILRDPEILPIGTELIIPGGSVNPTANPTVVPPMSQAIPPLLAPPPLEQFGPRTLAVSNSSWRNANEPAATVASQTPVAAPLNPVAITPWDQQLANAAPLQQSGVVAPGVPPASGLVNPAPTPQGWPPVDMHASPSPQVGWPPQPPAPSWPTRAWNSSESAMNWVGDKLLGTGSAPPQPGSKSYLVKPLETWETLAQRFYGDARYATTLQSANQQVPASKLRPGTVITVPHMPL
jgi:nucleoid-associated protein YgaU